MERVSGGFELSFLKLTQRLMNLEIREAVPFSVEGSGDAIALAAIIF